SGLWHERSGSLHLAYHPDEAQVLYEFATDPRHDGRGYVMLNARQVIERCSAVQPNQLITGLWSPNETCVDPREVVANLPDWLHRTYGVDFVFGRVVTGYERPTVRTTAGDWQAQQLVVCNGDDFQTLYPSLFPSDRIVRCKLQMM